jgi:hypothetical protein
MYYIRAYRTTIGDQISYYKINATCKEGKMYEYEYVLPDDTFFLGTSRPDHASVFRTMAGTQEPAPSARSHSSSWIVLNGEDLT